MVMFCPWCAAMAAVGDGGLDTEQQWLRNARAFPAISEQTYSLVWDVALFAWEGLVADPPSSSCTQFSHGILKAFRFKINNMLNSSDQPSTVLIIICQDITIPYFGTVYMMNHTENI